MKIPTAVQWPDVPSAMFEVARRRTMFLRGGPLETMPLASLLANAYLQGVNDAATTMHKREASHDR